MLRWVHGICRLGSLTAAEVRAAEFTGEPAGAVAGWIAHALAAANADYPIVEAVN